MEIKCFCPFWAVCGGAPMRQYWAKLTFPYGDPQRDYIATVCGDEKKHLECGHYKIRATKEEKNEAE